MGVDGAHARGATEVQWWSDQSLCHVAVNEMRGAGPSSDRIESSVPSAVLQVFWWRRAFSDSALYGAGGYLSSTRMSWLRAPIMLVIGASPEGPRPRPRRGRWSRLENRLGTWSRDSRLRLPRRALRAPGGRQLLCSRPSRRLEGRWLSDVAHDHLPRHADLVVVARLSNPHDGALVLTPPNHDSNLGPVVPMRAVGNVVEARERIFALLVAPQHFRVRHDDQVNLMLAGKPLQGPQRKPGIFGRRQMGRPVVLDLVPGIDDQ